MPRRPAVPAGSSSAARAPRQPARRQGRRVSTTLRTTSSRSRKTTSIAKRMKNMCTELVGRIRSPSPSSSVVRPSRTRIRVGAVSATMQRSQATVPSGRLSTQSPPCARPRPMLGILLGRACARHPRPASHEARSPLTPTPPTAGVNWTFGRCSRKVRLLPCAKPARTCTGLGPRMAQGAWILAATTMAERGVQRLRLIGALTIAGVAGLAGGALPIVLADDGSAIVTTTGATEPPCLPGPDGQAVTTDANGLCPVDPPPPPPTETTPTSERPPPTTATTETTPAPPPAAETQTTETQASAPDAAAAPDSTTTTPERVTAKPKPAAKPDRQSTQQSTTRKPASKQHRASGGR